MATLKEKIAEKNAQGSTLRRNPEVDAKLDKFIQEIPKLMEYYQALRKEELIRKLALGEMNAAEYKNGSDGEIKAWVEENSEIKAKIEDSIRRVPSENRERAFINAAKARGSESNGPASRITSVIGLCDWRRPPIAPVASGQMLIVYKTG
jgi:hypothetical protein